MHQSIHQSLSPPDNVFLRLMSHSAFYPALIILTVLWSYGGNLDIPLNGTGLFTIASGLQDINTFCGQGVYWRPLANYAARLLYAGFWIDPLAYHVLDLFIQGVNALLVYYIARTLSKDRVVALVAGLMFAAFYRHSALLFSGALFYEHGHAMFSLLAVASFLYYQNTNKKVSLAVSLCSILIALTLKDSALIVFPLILVIDQLYRPHPLPRIRWKLILCLTATGVVYFVCRVHFMPFYAGDMPSWGDPIKALGMGKMFSQLFKGVYITIANVCPGKDFSTVLYLGFALFIWKDRTHRRLALTTGTLLIISVLPLFFIHGLASRYVYFSTAFSMIFLAVVIRYSAKALAERLLPSYSDKGVALVTGVVLILILFFNIHKIHKREEMHREAGSLLKSNIEDIVTAFPDGTKGIELCLINNPISLPRDRGGVQVWDGDANWIMPLFYEEADVLGKISSLTTDLGYPNPRHQYKLSIQVSNNDLDEISRDSNKRIMVYNPHTKHLEDMTGKTSQEIRSAIANTKN